MESLGKKLDLSGVVVNQGINVFGNKGSTDQHAYVQQLRDGLSNFFVTFIEVLEDQSHSSLEVEPSILTGDFLQGFYLGTRNALFEEYRESITISVNKICPFSIGVLIALFERAVGLYSTLINVNAYHQPGVEAGKKAATIVLDLQVKITNFLTANRGKLFGVGEIASAIKSPDEVETIFKICERLAANPRRGIQKLPGSSPFYSTYKSS
jgi:glucose-6-phosphate isomerase